MPWLEQWAEIDVNGENSLIGYVYDDERIQPNGKFANGHRLITSKIQHLDLVNKTAQTRNTLYYLGDALQIEEKFDMGNCENFSSKKVKTFRMTYVSVRLYNCG
jgi:hypothetical protein